MSDFEFDFDIDKLRNKIDQEENGNFEEDNTRFNPAKDMKDDDVAIVRVMPTHDNSHYRVEHVYHQVNGKGKYYTCPTQFDYKALCPFCERAKSYYEQDNTKMGGKFWKKRRYGAFVHVRNADELGLTELKEPTVWWYGKQVETKFKAAIKDDEIGAFFHPINGFDFKLKKTLVRDDNGKEQPSYISSDFARSSSPLSDNDKVIKALFEARHDLKDDIEPALPYEKLEKLMNGGGASDDSSDDVDSDTAARLPTKKEPSKKDDDSSADDDPELADILAKINS